MPSEKNWAEELEILRHIVLKTGLTETIKWGASVFTWNNRNVVAMGGFKTFFALWFYNGVFLRDEHQVLVNAQEGVTKALRQWRFTSREEINEPLIREYIREAVANEASGKKLIPTPRTAVPVPDELRNILEKNPALQHTFAQLSQAKRNEYCDFVAGAKRETTRVARAEKIAPLIRSGSGLHDKYKK